MSHYVVGVEQVGEPDTATPFANARDALQFIAALKVSGTKITIFCDGTPIDEAALSLNNEDERTVILD